MHTDWQGRTALITGASRGIGAATARRLATSGAQVALLARDRDALLEVAANCRDVAPADTPDPLVFAVDATDGAPLKAVAEEVVAAFGGGLDLLANVAGSALRLAKLEEGTDADWYGSLELNLLAPVRLQVACFAALRARQGTIINVGSTVADRGAVLGAPYAAAKAALQSLTRSTTIEWAKHGIRAVTIEPGYVATDFNAGLVEAGLEERLLQRIPTRRAIEPDEIADVIAFAGHAANRSLTGATIKVDGGHTAGL